MVIRGFSIDFQLILLHVSSVTILFSRISCPNLARMLPRYPRICLQCQKSAGLVIGDPRGAIPLPGGVYPGNVKKIFVSELAETCAVGFYMS